MTAAPTATQASRPREVPARSAQRDGAAPDHCRPARPGPRSTDLCSAVQEPLRARQDRWAGRRGPRAEDNPEPWSVAHRPEMGPGDVCGPLGARRGGRATAAAPIGFGSRPSVRPRPSRRTIPPRAVQAGRKQGISGRLPCSAGRKGSNTLPVTTRQEGARLREERGARLLASASPSSSPRVRKVRPGGEGVGGSRKKESWTWTTV